MATEPPGRKIVNDRRLFCVYWEQPMPVYHDAELRLQIQQRMDDGRPSSPTPWHSLAGPGFDHTCAVCDEIVSPQVLEYEAQTRSDSARHFHAACCMAWFPESPIS